MKNQITDTALLDALELLVKAERPWEDVIICYDHEDGFWLASVERGTTHPWPIKDKDLKKRKSVRDAILAAIEWNNAESRKPHHGYLRIPLTPTPGAMK